MDGVREVSIPSKREQLHQQVLRFMLDGDGHRVSIPSKREQLHQLYQEIKAGTARKE